LRESTTHDDWQIRSRAASDSNIVDPLARIRVPTLVLHARGLVLTPPEGATKLAAMIPNARLVVISGDHPLGDAAEGLAAIEAFLAQLPAERQQETWPDAQGLLSVREQEVLRLIARGLSNQQMADELVISVRTVERHINHIYEKIGVHNRAQAAAYAVSHRSVAR
jgi:DNA-binding CsgD family transcriptional regulator